MNIRALTIASMVGFSALGADANATPAFSGIYVFGDSLSDAGNFGAFPSAPNLPGHFSNGPTWAEDLAGLLGLPLTPSESGGTDYAWGGATTGTPFNQPGPLGPLDIPTQVSQYTSSVAGIADPQALYIVWGGGNDLFGGNVSNSASNMGSVISTLASAGAKNFLIPNLPDVGLTPLVAGNPAGSAFLHALSIQFDSDLATVLQNLQSTLPIHITKLNEFDAANQVLASPASFGLTNVADACFSGGIVCGDPGSFFFWDSVHPTARGHVLISEFALAALNASSVPVPPAVWLFGSALGGLGLIRRSTRSGSL